MNWDDARIFLSFAREGSFSAAAKRLGVQHSTISRRIHALETQLATPLIERSANGFQLTASGVELRATALRIEKEMLAFEADNSGQNEDPSGELKVTAVANMASSILMPLFASFCRENPSVDLRIEVTNDSVRLAERDADVALRQTNSPGETLIGTRLTTVASAVYGSKSYCAAVHTGESSENWIGVDCCDYHRTWTRQACPDLQHSLCVDETSLTIAAIREGLGLGFLPCFIGDSDPDLIRFREPEIQHNLGLWLLYHRDLRDTKRVKVFREHMQRAITDVSHRFEGKLN
ncbi:LysR family transcriptional regulator [Congregibacter brevis]|uniref:LysR family transcriptional regulator n=1 Tax=Congregibacter brevis TaxID=3081201 RepID=A0ABZ0IC52_9GAMM|nr:LysR family transcriptional regulator [Congregibacter sp. IMCC45268]